MNLIAIETATDACSAALWLDGTIAEEFAIIPRQHTQQILPMLESLFSRTGLSFAQIDGLAFGCGPGSFTGLRIAASVIQGLAVAWDRPVVPVSTLNALAQGAYRITKNTHLFSCLDARMGEVYAGYYMLDESTGHMTLFSPEFLASPNDICFPPDIDWLGVGSGCKAYLSLFEQKTGFHWREQMGDIYPHAQDVAELAAARFLRGDYVSAEQALPVYLRDKVTGF